MPAIKATATIAKATATIATAATESIMGVSSGVDRRKQCGDGKDFSNERGHFFAV
jgi:hypothetical protein